MNSLILSTGTRAVFHTIGVFSVFLLFAGHNSPGGGFIGGLVAGAALVLRFVAEGPEDLRRSTKMGPPQVLGLGLLLALLAAVVPLTVGEPLLSSGVLEIDAPILGKIKATSVLVFDAGVYLVVVGLVLGILRTLGGELDAVAIAEEDML